MITKFTCTCGNTNPKKAYNYDGALGYEAMVCLICGNYSDFSGNYEADYWSKELINAVNHNKKRNHEKD